MARGGGGGHSSRAVAGAGGGGSRSGRGGGRGSAPRPATRSQARATPKSHSPSRPKVAPSVVSKPRPRAAPASRPGGTQPAGGTKLVGVQVAKVFKRGDSVTIPAKGVIGSTFGGRKDPKTGKPKMHDGVDVKVPVGTKVVAMGAGKVFKAGWENPKDHGQGYGLRVWVNHGQGNTSVYAHLSEKTVKVGDTVSRGQEIGKSGNTGKSTGPHLHYGEYHKGKAHEPSGNPAAYHPDVHQ